MQERRKTMNATQTQTYVTESDQISGHNTALNTEETKKSLKYYTNMFTEKLMLVKGSCSSNTEGAKVAGNSLRVASTMSQFSFAGCAF